MTFFIHGVFSCNTIFRILPKEFLLLIRDHWSIENGLHLVKDRWRDADKHVHSGRVDVRRVC